MSDSSRFAPESRKPLCCFLVLFLLAAFLVSLQPVVVAQNLGRSTGEIRGVIRDQTGGVLPGVTITITSPELIGEKVLVTDAQGFYAAPGLPKGTYRVQAEMDGFVRSAAEEIVLRIGDVLKIDLTLQAGFSESVTVTATPVIDVVSVDRPVDFSSEAIVELPKGRSWESIVDIAPAVNMENKNEVTGLSFQGASISENVYIIDGVNTTGVVRGTTGQDVIFEFLDNVQVQSGYLGAEYGGALGGVVNVTTKSGSNQFKGTLSLEYRSSGLTGDPRPRLRVTPTDSTQFDYVQDPQDPFRQFDVGGVLGGPILQDTLWFFGGYMPRFTDTERDVTFASTGETRSFSNDRSSHFLMGKLTWRAAESVLVNFNYTRSPFKSVGQLPGLDGLGDPTLDYSPIGEERNKNSFSGNFQWTASPNIFIEAFAGWYKQNGKELGTPVTDRRRFVTSNLHMTNVPAEFQGPAGLVTAPDTFNEFKNDEERLNFGVTSMFMFSAGGLHTLKAGVQYSAPRTDQYAGYTGERVDLHWDSSFFGQRGTYGYWREFDFNIGGIVESQETALFIQDAWSLAERWTVTLGLRAESEHLTPNIAEDNTSTQDIEFGFGDKLAPRVGVAWDVRGDGTWKAYANAGVFYDTLKQALFLNNFGGARNVLSYYKLETPDWMSLNSVNPDGDLIYEFHWGTGAPIIDGDLKPASMREWSVGTEYQIGREVAFSARFLRRTLHNAVDDIHIQDPTTGKMVVALANPGQGIASYQLGTDYPRTLEFERNYSGLEIQLIKRMSDNWAGNLSYTLSRLEGNYDGIADADEYGLQAVVYPNASRVCEYLEGCYTASGEPVYGPLGLDRPHQLKLSGSYNAPFGLSIGVFFQAKSGTPISRVLGINEGPVTFPEGRLSDGRTDFFTQTDLLLQYGFDLGEQKRLTVMANIFNLFDQDAVVRVSREMLLGASSVINVPKDQYFAGFDYQSAIDASGSARDPRFLQPNLYQLPRAVRIGLRFDF